MKYRIGLTFQFFHLDVLVSYEPHDGFGFVREKIAYPMFGLAFGWEHI